MITEEEFIALDRDFIDSQDFVQLAGDVDGKRDFVCHHNAYLVAGFLQQRGHDCRWVSGYYRCNAPAPHVRHSWIEIRSAGQPAIILEFDPRQLSKRGGYSEDLMPSGYIPEFGIHITPIAVIVSAYHVELPSDPDRLRFVVCSQEVLERYVPDRTLTPDIDLDRLDALAVQTREYYDQMKANECNENENWH